MLSQPAGRPSQSSDRGHDRPAKLKPRVTIGNFAQCPKLPAGVTRASFLCSIIHITGGLLDLGASHQIINREISISFGEGTDAKGNVVFLQGTLKSAPMPVLGGINPVFGSNCSVGTKTAPVVLDPTFGTTNPPPPPNLPETGNIAAFEQQGKEIVIIGTVVDNAFAAPAETGCGPSGVLNRIVNAVGGLPSAAGTNNAVFQVTVEAVSYADI